MSGNGHVLPFVPSVNATATHLMVVFVVSLVRGDIGETKSLWDFWQPPFDPGADAGRLKCTTEVRPTTADSTCDIVFWLCELAFNFRSVRIVYAGCFQAPYKQEAGAGALLHFHTRYWWYFVILGYGKPVVQCIVVFADVPNTTLEGSTGFVPHARASKGVCEL